MKTSWTSGVKDRELAQDIRASFAGSLVIRKRLKELAENKIRSADRGSIDPSEYDCPNWALKQADRAGYIRALREIQSLLEDSSK